MISQLIMVTVLMSRVGDRNKYEIHLPLPPKIDPTVTMWQVRIVSHHSYTLPYLVMAVIDKVEEKPDVTYSDVGGCKEQIEKLREVVETPLLHVSHTILPLLFLLLCFYAAREIC